MEAPAGDKPVEDPQAEPQADANPFAANTQAPEPAKAEEKPATNNADDDNPFVSIGNKRQY
jgi:hypothetical protein